jgi:hypothetical protein
MVDERTNGTGEQEEFRSPPSRHGGVGKKKGDGFHQEVGVPPSPSPSSTPSRHGGVGKKKRERELAWDTIAFESALVLVTSLFVGVFWAGDAYFTLVGMSDFFFFLSSGTGLSGFFSFWLFLGNFQWIIPLSMTALEVGVSGSVIKRFFPNLLKQYPRLPVLDGGVALSIGVLLTTVDFATTYVGLQRFPFPEGSFFQLAIQQNGWGLGIFAVFLTGAAEVGFVFLVKRGLKIKGMFD